MYDYVCIWLEGLVDPCQAAYVLCMKGKFTLPHCGLASGPFTTLLLKSSHFASMDVFDFPFYIPTFTNSIQIVGKCNTWTHFLTLSMNRITVLSCYFGGADPERGRDD